jgi:hypothetical protein
MAFWGDLGSFEGSDGKIVRSDCKNGSWVAKNALEHVAKFSGFCHYILLLFYDMGVFLLGKPSATHSVFNEIFIFRATCFANYSLISTMY